MEQRNLEDENARIRDRRRLGVWECITCETLDCIYINVSTHAHARALNYGHFNKIPVKRTCLNIWLSKPKVFVKHNVR